MLCSAEYTGNGTSGPVNDYGEQLRDYVDDAAKLGFQGIYLDESTYSNTPLNYNPLVSDGVSGVLASNGTVLSHVR
eukprot:COSAG05_NODE_613_length_8348_cov_10.272275_4_plen_76_part_00